jgi:hypothetical protein
MGEFFRQTSQQLTPIGFRYDDNGKVWIQAVTHGALVADSPYKVVPGQNGYITEAIASGTAVACFVGFAKKAWSTGDVADLQIGGEIDDVTLTTGTAYTAGEYVALVAGAFTSNAADNVYGIFGAVTETATGAGDPNLMLTQIAPINVTS